MFPAFLFEDVYMTDGQISKQRLTRKFKTLIIKHRVFIKISLRIHMYTQFLVFFSYFFYVVLFRKQMQFLKFRKYNPIVGRVSVKLRGFFLQYFFENLCFYNNLRGARLLCKSGRHYLSKYRRVHYVVMTNPCAMPYISEFSHEYEELTDAAASIRLNFFFFFLNFFWGSQFLNLKFHSPISILEAIERAQRA